MERSVRSRRGTLVGAEVLLVSAMVLSPLAIGTVHLWSVAVMAGLVGASAILAASARPQLVEWPGIAALALVGYAGLQLVPLPRPLLGLLSPHALELLEFSLGRIGHHSLSLDSTSTAREFARLLAFALALLVASRLASDGRAARRLALVVGVLTIVQCVAIVAHKVVATNAIYGVIETTQGNIVLGTFGNSNYLAGYLALGVPLLGALALSARETGDRVAWGIAAAVASVMVMLTGSRSGVAGLWAAVIVFALLLRRQLAQARTAVLGASTVLIVGGVAAVLLNTTRRAKYGSLLHLGQVGDEMKVRAWRDVPALIHDYWLTGIGRGAFETVFPGYKRMTESITFSHIECAPLQVMADFGLIVGAALLAAWLGAIVLAARREHGLGQGRGKDREDGVLAIGAVAALAGISVHELGDFSLDMSGAVGLTAAVLFGLLWPAHRRAELPAEGPVTQRARALRLAGVVALLALGAGALTLAFRGDLGRDIARLNQAASVPGAEVEPMVQEAIARHPGESWFNVIGGLDRIRHRQPATALRYLNRALVLDPTAWRPHQLLGEALLQLGHRQQALLEYRLAYVGSSFSSGVITSILSHRELRAEELLDGLAATGPGALSAYAGFLEGAGRDEAAVAAGTRLLEAHAGEEVHARRLLARVELRRHHLAEAITHARALPAEDAEGLLVQVQALDALGRGAEADALLAAADKAPFAQPLVAATGTLLADRALARNHTAAALSALDRIPQDGLSPEQLARIQLQRSRALEQSGRVREAIMEAEHASRINPCETTWLALGGIYERVGLLREALLVYRGAVRSTPHPSDGLRERLARVEGGFQSPTIEGSGTGRHSTEVEEILGGTPGKGDDESATPEVKPGSDEDDEEER